MSRNARLRQLRIPALACGLCTATPTFALEIIGNHIPPTASFPNSSRIAEGQHATSVGGGNVQAVFEAAASAWENVIKDPWTVAINYGWDDQLTYAYGETFGMQIDTTTGRVSEANIRFRSDISSVTYPDIGWYLDPAPDDSVEYGEQMTAKVDLGGGSLNSARHYFATESDPPKYSAVVGGAYPDLLSNAIHEIGHALNVNTVELNRIDRDGDGDVEITLGPYAGTEIDWATRGGGHPDQRWPDANLAMLGIFEPPHSHRTLISDMDAVLIAEVSEFKRVALPDIEYVDLPDFSDSSVLTMNGDAVQVGDVLRLTPDASSQSGSAFLTLPFATTQRTAFSSEFVFEIGGLNGGGAQGSDGFAFVIHGDPRGENALGIAGGNLGLGDLSFGTELITPSIAIEFDTHRNFFDADDNHVAVIANGDVSNHLGAVASPFLLNAGTPLRVWLDYDPLTDLLDIYLSNQMIKPADPLLTRRFGLDLLADEVWFGFTAGTGGGFNYHDIQSWNLQVFNVPVPGTLPLLAIALVDLRRRTRPPARRY